MNWVVRGLCLVLGLLALGVGVLGIFLPLLPTTPLVLLAAYFFSKGSPAFYHWLLALPKIGPVIRAWNQHGAIGRRPKVMAVVAMVAVGLYLGLKELPWVLKICAWGSLAAAMGFVISRPEWPPQARGRPGPHSRA